MKKHLLPILAATTGLIISQSLHAQTEPLVWIYSGTGTSISPIFSGDTQIMQDQYYAEIGGTDMSDNQYIRWSKLYQGLYPFGSNAGSKVRALDMIEDYDLNWSTDDIVNTDPYSRWVALENGNSVSTWNFRYTDNTGPHPNELFYGNTNIIALADDHAIFIDDDGTISYYYLSGGLNTDATWTHLTGGSLDNFTLSSVLATHFIGAEEQRLAFLVGPDVVEFYNVHTGEYVTMADYSDVDEGPLAGAVTLEDFINGNVEGWSFIGIDGFANPGPVLINIPNIPEPSSALFIGIAGLLGFNRLRRKKMR